MKLKKYIKSLIIVIAFILPFSCSQGEDEKEQKTKLLSPTYETVERTHPNCNDQDENNGCTRLEFTYPVFSDGENMPVKDTLRQAVSRFIFDSPDVPLNKESFDELARDWFDQYDATLEEISDYNLPWEERIRIRLIHQTPEYVSVEFEEYEYSGGAHGNELKMYRMFNIPDGTRLKLSDILEDVKEKQLSAVAEDAFRELKKFPDDIEYDERNYFFKEGLFTLNNNFALTEKGLIFHYNPYEIAPYSEGHTRLILTYDQIDTLLAEPYLPSSVVNK